MRTRPLHYERRGRGPAVMLLHGFTGNGRSMGDVSLALARDFEVIAPDLPGHGRSIGADDGPVYPFDECLDRLAETLEHAGHPRAHWLGYSMGARLALAFALRFPGRVSSLLLVGGRAGIVDASERAARRRADDALADRIEADGIEAFIDEWLAQPLFESQRRRGHELVAVQRRQRLDNDARALAASLRAAPGRSGAAGRGSAGSRFRRTCAGLPAPSCQCRRSGGRGLGSRGAPRAACRVHRRRKGIPAQGRLAGEFHRSDSC